MVLVMRTVERGGICCHRAVQVDRQRMRNLAFFLETMEVVQHHLRAPDRERGNHHHAAARCRFADDFRQRVHRVFRIVLAIAVSGFHHQVVSMFDQRRRRQHGISGTAEVAGKRERRGAVVEADHRGAENVACTKHSHVQPGRQRNAFAERHRRELPERMQCVIFRVKRECGIVLGVTVAIGEEGFFFQQPSAVGQHDLAEIERGTAAVNLSTESVFYQQGDVAAVVEVRVGKHNRIERRRFHWQRRTVAQTQLLVSLEQSAIDEDRRTSCAQQIARSRHGSGGA